MLFSIIEVLIFIGIAQGMSLTFALLKMKNRNKTASSYIVFLLITTMIILVGRLRYTNEFNQFWMRKWMLMDVAFYLYGPLLYAYLKQLTSTGTYRNATKHYLTAIIFFVSIIFLNFLPEEKYYLLSNKMTQSSEGILFWFFTGAELLIIISLLIYTGLCFILLKRYKREEHNSLSFEQSTISYLLTFLLIVLVCSFCWVGVFIQNHFLIKFQFIDYQVIWLGIVISTFIIGYYSMVHAKIFRLEYSNDNRKIKSERLSQKGIDELSRKINDIIISKKVYQDAKLTLVEFSKLIGFSTNDVSWFLNNVKKMSFYDFINQLRIEEFVKKVESREYETRTILALSFEVGFNSNSTFYKAFKNVMHETPSHFIRKFKAQLAL